MGEKRAIDLAYEIIWGTRPLKDVHVALGEIIARENAELVKLRDTKPVTGDAAWFSQYRKNVEAMAKEATVTGRAVGYVGPEGETELVPDYFQKAEENALHHAEAGRRKSFDAERGPLERVLAKADAEYEAIMTKSAAEKRAALRKTAYKTSQEERDRLTRKDWSTRPIRRFSDILADACAANNGDVVALVEAVRATDAPLPRHHVLGQRMRVIDQMFRNDVPVWLLLCEFEILRGDHKGQTARRWVADDGRLILVERGSAESHAKT